MVLWIVMSITRQNQVNTSIQVNNIIIYLKLSISMSMHIEENLMKNYKYTHKIHKDAPNIS